jgi:plasmid stabilization system protein ParE
MLRFSRRAEHDVIEILEYLEKVSPAGARNVARTFARTAELIERYPQAGRVAGEQDSRVVQAGRYPYLVYWVADGADVTILHVRHTARRPWGGEGK